jgi:2,3-bisphosphoglycerate-independent phosphoglycerate mutase
MLVLGKGEKIKDPVQAVLDDYKNGKTDEFIEPKVVVSKDKPVGKVEDGDGVFFFNFRADRARQLVMSLFMKDFNEFKRTVVPKLCMVATMTQYDKNYPLPVAFPPLFLKNIMGEVCSKKGLKQLRIAETEKYAHVTYFFNGGREEPFEGEDRKLIPSPKEVPTYDLKPEMSVYEVVRELEDRWTSGKYDFVVCNFANLDMVGHTGNFEATVKACEAVDECVGLVIKMLNKRKGRLFVTADHGNADEMLDKDGNIHTAHSTNPVAFIWYEPDTTLPKLYPQGKLGDIAPTILDSWGFNKPAEMTGNSLIQEW